MLGLGGKVAAGMIGGPVAGAAAGKGLDYLFTRNEGPGEVTRSEVAIPGGQVYAPNLGFGGGRMNIGRPMIGPTGGMTQFGNNLDNFMVPSQGPGIAGGFMGNGQFNFGPGSMAARPGGRSPWGGSSYQNDAWGDTAAAFGVGAGNSGFGNFQSGGNIRGHLYRE